MTTEQWIEKMNKAGKKSWLIVKVCQSSVNPKRDDNNRPLREKQDDSCVNRFLFQVDGFTVIDFDITETNNLRVVCNSTILPELLVCAPLENKALFDFKNGETYTFEQLYKAIVNFCRLSNERLNS